MATLSLADFAVFGSYMLLLVGVGVWFTRQQKGLKSYLLADQNVHWLVVAVSVLAALFSGITYLGAPAETYFNDLTYLWVFASFFIATPITTLVFLPFFRNLQLYTAYEYLERRFDRRLRTAASLLFVTRIAFHLALAVYAPALAITAVTGWDLRWCVALTGLAATVYTTLGGMKAVIWTDTIQFLVLCGGIALVLGYAVAHVPGGLPAAWQSAVDHDKTRFLNFDLNPTARMTVWSALLGGGTVSLIQMVTDQISVQRYLTAPSLKASQRALWFKLWVTLPLLTCFCVTGTVLFAYYQAFPQRGPAGDMPKDQLLPHFVVHELPAPVPGLLIAAVFGATMAVASAGINALATTVLLDFSRAAQHAAGRQQVVAARLLTVVAGLVVTALALSLGHGGKSLVELILMFQGLFGGPVLGLFFLGVLSRRANGSGALLGATAGAAVGVAVGFSKALFDYPISFTWIGFAAAVTTFVCGHAASLFFAPPAPAAQSLVYRPWRAAAEPAGEPAPAAVG